MERIFSTDAKIFYDVAGEGPPVLLLHPFPLHHEFWLPVASILSARYRLIMPDLRGHGESELGEGPATMQKHARDLAQVLSAAGAERATIVGVSIGGYAIFEFWRELRDRVKALVLCNTKAGPDTGDARVGRLQAADDVLAHGTEKFCEGMLEKVLAASTRRSRPDLVDGALQMMRNMSPEDVAGVQRGMAERPDSVPMLKTISVPTMIVTGDEDKSTGVTEAEILRQNIAGSDLRVIAKAGHYAAWEQPEEAGKILRSFLDAVHRK